MKTLITVALTSYLLPDSEPISPLAWRSLKQFVESVDQDELIRFAEKNLTQPDAKKIADRLKRISEMEAAIQKLEQHQVSILTEFDTQYPKRWIEKFGDRCPSHIYFSGNADLLNHPMIGIVGSRDIDRAGSEFAEAVAQAAVAAGFGVVSGGARGVDRLAMNAGYQADGETVGVLADSLLTAAQEAERAGAFDYGRTCLCSPYIPTAGFQVGNAMARNKLIYALSGATVVVSAAEGSGGTWAGAIEAMEAAFCPLMVRSGPDIPTGNKRLIEKGATALVDPGDLSKAIIEFTSAQGSLF